MARPHLVIPGPGKPDHELFLEKAIALKYPAATLGLGVPSDPTKAGAQLVAYEEALERLLTAGLFVITRLPHDPPQTPYWLKAADDQSWSTPYDPPAQLIDELAAWDMALLARAQRARASAGVTSEKTIFEIAREKGIGGVNGPCLGRWSLLTGKYQEFKKLWDSWLRTQYKPTYEQAKVLFHQIFPAWCWVDGEPLAEGTIHPRSLRFLADLRDKLSFGGCPVIFTFEGSYTAEIKSFEGADAKRIAAKMQIGGLHHYAGGAINQWVKEDGKPWYQRNLTPEELAEKWVYDPKSGLNAKLAWLAANPLLTTKGRMVVEANVLRKLVPYGADVAKYRLALLRKAMEIESATSVGIFTAIELDAASSGAGLWRYVDGELVPDGSVEVGPINLAA